MRGQSGVYVHKGSKIRSMRQQVTDTSAEMPELSGRTKRRAAVWAAPALQAPATGQSSRLVLKSRKNGPMGPQGIGRPAESTELSGRAKRGAWSGHKRSAPQSPVIRLGKAPLNGLKALKSLMKRCWYTLIHKLPSEHVRPVRWSFAPSSRLS
jgi:hypothetical protein